LALYHVNFKTLGGRPIFEQEEYDRMLRACLPSVLQQREVISLAWEIMPTHVHLLIADFPDYPRSTILQHVKGDVARAFFRAFPHLRHDLLGGHLWAKGYYWVAVESHRQCRATIAYIQANRECADLAPPMELQVSSD
jgi:REP element-mobilizing transposase RayT